MGKYTEQFPNLKYILAAYFHEDQFDAFDWKGNAKDYRAIIKYFKTKESSERVLGVIQELKDFLVVSQNWDEDKLFDVLLYDFGGTLSAYRFDLTYRKFLEGILEIFSSFQLNVTS